MKQIEYDAEEGDFVAVDGESEDITDLQKDIDGQITDIYSEFGGEPNEVEFRIDVKRTIPNKGVNEDCFSCSIEELPIKERIRNEFGSGLYQIYIYKNKKLFRRRTLRLAAPIKHPVVNNATLQGGGIKDILAAMAENQHRQYEQMKELMLSQNAQPSQTDQMTHMLQTMALMKQVMGEPVKATDPMKVLEVAKGLAESMGDGGDKSSLDRLIESALPVLIEGAKNPVQNAGAPTPLMNNPIRPVAPPVSVNVPIPNQSPPNQLGKPQDEKDMLKQIVRSRLPQLLSWAAQDRSPGLYAEVILDQIPGAFMEKYIEFVKTPDCISQLAILNSEVNQYIHWFNQFRDETLSFINDAETDVNLTEGGEVVQTSEHVPGQTTPGDVVSDKNPDDRNPGDDT